VQTAQAGRTTMKSDLIRVRIDADVKKQVEAILDKLGLTQSSVVNLLYSHILLHQGLPFEVKIPNAATQQAIDDAFHGRDMASFSTPEELFQELDGPECGPAESPKPSRRTTTVRKSGVGISRP
jgi:DNA-damage-inducible protein J